MAERDTVSGLIEINGTLLPGISKYSCDTEDIDAEDSGRAEDGTAHRDILRANVMKISVEHIVDNEELELILSLIKSKKEFEATVYCPTAAEGGSTMATSTFYVSKASFSIFRMYEDDKLWCTLSYAMVEV